MHIPFCKQACTYCNFHFSTSLRQKGELVNAIIKEAGAEKDYLRGEIIHTVYFGGGTPSLLDKGELASILEALHQNYPIAEDVEITLEANPDDINPNSLSDWKNLGINRLSIGVQSFMEEELRWMNRAHNSVEAIRCLEMARSEFDNITMDLIYGSPLLSDEMWKAHVDKALALGIPHLSCYALTVEEKTPLHKQIRNAKIANVDSDRQARQFFLLMQWLRERGYEHYEVSNFALPGFRSRHNSAYWKGVPYLGLGPSAHSFNGTHRRWNIANNNVYIESIKNNEPARETEELTNTNRLNETIMICLRTTEGLDLGIVEKEWGVKERSRLEKDAAVYIKQGLAKKLGSIIKLTDEGMLRADGIAADLFA